MGRALRFSGVVTIACAAALLGQGGASAQAAFDAGLAFDRPAAEVPPGNSVLLTPSYTVTGTAPAGADLGFTVVYPQGLSVEASNGQCTVSSASRTVHCTSPAEGARPQMRVTVDSSAKPGDVLVLTATVDPVPGDSDPSDDTATATVTVVPLEARVDVAAPASARAGQPFTVVVRLGNDSDVAVGDDFRGSVTMSGAPDGGEELFRWVSLPASCGTDPASYQCGAGGTVRPGGTRTYGFRLEPRPGAAGHTFTMSARWSPADTTEVEDAVRVRILPAAAVVRPGMGTTTRPAVPTVPAVPATSAAAAPELAATGSNGVLLGLLGLGLLGVGALLPRPGPTGRRTSRP